MSPCRTTKAHGRKWTPTEAGRRARPVAMRLPAWLYFASLLAAAPGLAQEDATVAGVPLDIPGNAALRKYDGALRRAYREVLEGQTGVVASDEERVTAALRALTKADYGESDVTLARVAYGAGSLYALYVLARLGAEGALVVSGRVVRNDGKQMSVGTARVSWLKGRKPVEVSREAFLQLFGVLGLGRLPAVKEAPPVAEEASVAPVEPRLLPPPPEPPPLVEAVQPAQFPMRPVAYAAIGVGLAVAVAGLVAFGAEPPFEKDAWGNVREADLAAYRSARTLAGLGTGLLVGGLAVAGAGGVLLLTAPSGAPVASVGVSLGCTRSAVALALGGQF